MFIKVPAPTSDTNPSYVRAEHVTEFSVADDGSTTTLNLIDGQTITIPGDLHDDLIDGEYILDKSPALLAADPAADEAPVVDPPAPDATGVTSEGGTPVTDPPATADATVDAPAPVTDPPAQS